MTVLDKYGFPEGSGIFTTIRTIDNHVIALNRHMRRVLKSADELGMRIADEETIRREIVELLSSHPHKSGRLRLCFSNEGHHFSHDQYQETDIPARITFWSDSVDLQMPVHKRYPYTDRLTIRESAQFEGYDDALLFNKKNEVTETSVSNIILRINHQWVTPPISAGILPGIMRQIAIEECGVQVRAIHVSEIPEVTSAFLLSSLRIAQPVSHICDFKVEIGEPSQALEAKMREKAFPVSVS